MVSIETLGPLGEEASRAEDTVLPLERSSRRS